ncbi:MAG: hypothetical protein K5829_04670 [Treponema sp.]|nr:hypothetical protein [Treponema sp.]
MKKIFIILVIAAIFSVSAFAQNTPVPQPERHESMWSDMTYENIPILKIMEGKEGYIVMYQKNKIGVGSTVIPKKWAQGNPETPRKLKFRNSKNSREAFMTVIKKNGEFSRVVLTVPYSKNTAIWGLADYRVKMDGADKETLEELDL